MVKVTGIVISLVIGLVVFFAVVILLRLVGAWMLRIDEIIELQKHTLRELKKISQKLEDNDQSNPNL